MHFSFYCNDALCFPVWAVILLSLWCFGQKCSWLDQYLSLCFPNLYFIISFILKRVISWSMWRSPPIMPPGMDHGSYQSCISTTVARKLSHVTFTFTNLSFTFTKGLLVNFVASTMYWDLTYSYIKIFTRTPAVPVEKYLFCVLFSKKIFFFYFGGCF